MRWRYYLVIVGSALALMGGNCGEGAVVPCTEDADCASTCNSECQRRGEELLSSVCADNQACQCTCSSLGTGGAGGGNAGAGGGGGFS